MQQMPAPSSVLVYNFAASPDEVGLTQGIDPQVLQAMDDKPRTAEERRLGHAIAAIITTEIIDKLENMGLSARRAPAQPAANGNTLLIKGQLLSIDKANEIESTVIGLDFGGGQIGAAVQVAEIDSSGILPVESLSVKAEQDAMSDAAQLMGLDTPAGHETQTAVLTASSITESGELSAAAYAEAKRFGAKIADQLHTVFQQQGWVD